MGRRTVTQLANQIKRVLSPTLINDLGREVGFCVRERLITPYRLVLSLLAGHTMGQVETLADIQRQFNALFATTVAYKPCNRSVVVWHRGLSRAFDVKDEPNRRLPGGRGSFSNFSARV